MREHTAAVYIRHQQHRAINRSGETHVRDIIFSQVDFSRTAGSFNDNHVVLSGKAMISRQGMIDGCLFEGMIFDCIHVSNRLPVDNYLRSLVTVRLQQNRIHVGMGQDAAGQGLNRLGSPDLSAVDGDRAVQRHILGFEWRNADSLFRKQPT